MEVKKTKTRSGWESYTDSLGRRFDLPSTLMVVDCFWCRTTTVCGRILRLLGGLKPLAAADLLRARGDPIRGQHTCVSCAIGKQWTTQGEM